MADLKDLGIFSTNKGLEKIKEDAARKDKEKTEKLKELDIEKKIRKNKKDTISKSEKAKLKKGLKERAATKKSPSNPKGAGAPITKNDKAISATQSIKVSALLNSVLRILIEKYMTSNGKDEILRIALNDFIKLNFNKEDKQDLLISLTKELELYREKNPTIPKMSEDGRILRTVSEIEAETIANIKKEWGID